MNTRFEPRDVDTTFVDSLLSNKVFRIFRTKTQTRIQKTVHVYSHLRADMFAMHCSSSGLGASRFFLGAPFSSSARFFLCARFLFATTKRVIFNRNVSFLVVNATARA